jgi:hypothetical protein
MKRIIIFIFIVLVVFSCKKTRTKEEIEAAAREISYTDSFSPQDWENPIARKQIPSGDKDIGNFIKEDTIDMKQRLILNTTKKFIELIRAKNQNEIAKLMTASIYNSYLLRYSDLTFKSDYDLRVEQPKDLSSNKIWIMFKAKFKNKSLIGKIEFEFTNDTCKVSDFEEPFFNDLRNIDSEK